MQKLVQGIHQFRRAVFSARREEFERLIHGQTPLALFITCSDSRVEAGLITQTSPGDLFVLRNAGNIVPAHGAVQGGEAATIEYAIAALGITDIVICGHTQCGAMKAVLDPSSTKNLPAVSRWLENAAATSRILKSHYSHLEGEALLTAAVEENVLVQLENLKTHPEVLTGITGKRIRLHGWVYRLETGQVFAYDSGSSQFQEIGTTESGMRGVGGMEARVGA